MRTAGTMFVICPGDPGPVSLVSPVSDVDQQLASVSVQLAGQPGHHRQLSFSWLEMRPLLQVSALTTDQSRDHCSHVCPSLHSCIHSSLWCDGVNNCPDGADEVSTRLDQIYKLTFLSGSVSSPPGSSLLLLHCSGRCSRHLPHHSSGLDLQVH